MDGAVSNNALHCLAKWGIRMGSNHPDRTVQWSRQALQVDNLLQQLTQDKPK